MTTWSTLSLFEPTDTDPPRVRDMVVGPASMDDLHEFARRHHYTGIGGTGNWRWGLWCGATLFGVVAYNLPVRSVCASVFGTEHEDNVWHMGRLVLSDAAPRNSESRLIGGSLRAIRREFPHVWAVLTYAATSVGHIGYVYQATNALYTGRGGYGAYYVDRDGNRRSTYQGGRHLPADRARERGWTLVAEPASKHRYVYVLGSRTERRHRMALLKLPVLPYPKPEVAP